VKNFILLVMATGLSIVYADCPDALYNCFADKTPQIFTYEEIELQNKVLNNQLDRAEHVQFPFVSVGTYFEPLSLRCVKKSDALERATKYCKAKFPGKQLNVQEFVKKQPAEYYLCTENDKKTKINVLAYDQESARIKCTFIATSLGQDNFGWDAQKVSTGIFKKVLQKLDLDEIPLDFLNEWHFSWSQPEAQRVLPLWLQTILKKAPLRDTKDIEPHKLTILSAIQNYREKFAKEPALTALGDALNKPNLLSSPQPDSKEIATICRRLKLLYHPDKHQENKEWWNNEFKRINDACSALIS